MALQPLQHKLEGVSAAGIDVEGRDLHTWAGFYQSPSAATTEVSAKITARDRSDPIRQDLTLRRDSSRRFPSPVI